MCFGEYILYKSGENYSINSCDTIEMFYNIRTDLDKISYAVYITKIIQDITNENENSYKVLQLYLNTLYLISETEKDIRFILSVFRIKLLCILGFKPIINECVNCGKRDTLNYFSIKGNGVKCQECYKQDKSSINISGSTWAALNFIISSTIKKVFGFNLKEDSLKELELLSKIYFNEKLEKEYKIEKFW